MQVLNDIMCMGTGVCQPFLNGTALEADTKMIVVSIFLTMKLIL